MVLLIEIHTIFISVAAQAGDFPAILGGGHNLLLEKERVGLVFLNSSSAYSIARYITLSIYCDDKNLILHTYEIRVFYAYVRKA